MEKLTLLKEIKDMLEFSKVNGGSAYKIYNLSVYCTTGGCGGPVPYHKPASYDKPQYSTCTQR